MDVFDSLYYRRIKLFLDFCGFWPYGDIKDKIINQSFMMILTMTVFGAQGAKLFEMRHEFYYFLLGLPSFFFYVKFVLKTTYASIKRKEIKNIVDAIHEDFNIHKDEELKILYEYAGIAHKINGYYTNYLVIACFAYSAAPFTLHTLDIVMPLANGTRLMEKPRFIKYYIDQFDNSMYFIIIHGFLSDSMAIIFESGFDMLCNNLAHHMCGLFVIVTNRMMYSVNTNNNLEIVKKENLKNKDVFYQNIVNAATAHQHVLELMQDFESAFSILNLLSLACIFTIMTITGFEVLLYKANFSEMVRFIGFALGEISHLLFYNWSGQKIRDYSLLVYQACYNTKWYEANIDEKEKRIMQLMMVRSQKPCQVTAGKIYILGLENFANIVKLSMSYFTVLNSMI